MGKKLGQEVESSIEWKDDGLISAYMENFPEKHRYPKKTFFDKSIEFICILVCVCVCQAVPAGSHVRLNLQTGQREVRLGEEQLKYWTQNHRCGPRVTPDSYRLGAAAYTREANQILEERIPKIQTLDRQDMAQLELLVETDFQIMKRLLEQLNSSGSTVEQKLSVLLELEYLVHQVDNAQSLCTMGGLELILQGLNSSDVRLQESSAFVLGSALSGNPVVQVKVVESGALQTLLTLLATSKPLKVKKKVLFALASLLRHFPYAQRQILSHGGLQVLSELFRADEGGVLRTRIVTMLYDMISEKVHKTERVRQYAAVSLQAELLEKGWCILVPQLLESTEHDDREKALHALLVMAPVCLEQYRLNSSLLGSLLSLRDQYQGMVQTEMVLGEEHGYFAEILELIDALQVQVK
uniref:Nucleotide exchange factor SIL1 n=1 Tax=Mola mola TaxID=94237 RepID=A0A3Q3WWW4_MOLML